MADITVKYTANSSPFKGEADYNLYFAKGAQKLDIAKGEAFETDRENDDGWKTWQINWTYIEDDKEKHYNERRWADGIDHLCVEILPIHSGMFSWVEKYA